MVKATSLLVLISRFIVPPGGICQFAFFTTPMGPAIVVVTTINFDSLPQPQDSPFSRDGSDSPAFPVDLKYINRQRAGVETKRLESFPSCTVVPLVVMVLVFIAPRPPEKQSSPQRGV
jgi:hypothetical protein